MCNEVELLCGQVFDLDISKGNPDAYTLLVEPARASDLSKRINALLFELRRTRSNYAACFVVRQGELFL